MYYEKLPTIGFKYGEMEYVSTKHFKFSLNELVIWTISNPSKPLVGEIEFLGKPRNGALTGYETGTIAVVKWNQPTCYLPGHVANMTGNKTVVPTDQLVKKGNEQFCLNINALHGDNTFVELIGNCMANQHGVKAEPSNQISLGKPVVILADNKFISGTVEAYCSMNAYAETEKYAGVKLVKSLSTLYPKVQLRHAKNVKICTECARETLVYIRSDLLSIIGKDVQDFTKIGFPTPSAPARSTSVTDNSISPNNNEEPTTTETMSSGMLIGNCVAHSLKLDDCQVDNIREGSKVVANNNELTAHGRVIKVCEIHGLENVTSNYYVGVFFQNIPLRRLFKNEETIQHKDLNGKAPSACKLCDGGRFVFINTEVFSNDNHSSVDEVVFKIN